MVVADRGVAAWHHDLVTRLVLHAEQISEQLRAFKALALSETQAFKAEIASLYDAKKGGADGNMTLRSYDGRYVLRLAVQKHRKIIISNWKKILNKR